MRNRLFLILIIFGTVLYGFYLQKGYEERHRLVGKMAPDFSVKNESGKTISLSDLKGRVVLVHFWATWCVPCLYEIPSLNDLQKSLDHTKFALVAISMDEKREDVVSFRKKVQFDFPVFFDSTLDVVDAYGTFRLPESFLVNKEGLIVKKWIGPQEWESPGYAKLIQELF